MKDDVLESSLKALEAVRKEVGKSPEKARAFLVKAGIVTKTGKLTKKYRQVA